MASSKHKPKLEHLDCNGQPLRVGQKVYSTQNYQMGPVIEGEVVTLHSKRTGIIEVWHDEDFDTNPKNPSRIWEMASFLWSTKPTKPGPPLKEMLEKVQCPCCRGTGKVTQLKN